MDLSNYLKLELSQILLFIFIYNSNRERLGLLFQNSNSHLEQLTNCLMQLNYKFMLREFYSVSYVNYFNNSSSF